MKKLFLLLLATAALAACNDDPEKIHYASTNEGIENGKLTGKNMHFYGRAVVTADDGSEYIDEEAYFEFAGGQSGDGQYITVYMHKTRFAAQMPALEMRIYHTPYTGSGMSVSFSAASIVPEVLLSANNRWQPLSSYTLTDMEGLIDDVQCTLSFTCTVPKLGTYRMQYEGKLVIKG